MSGWIIFWKVLLVFSLAVYAALVLCVTVGGFKDILTMFRTLDEEHRHAGEKDNSNSEGNT